MLYRPVFCCNCGEKIVRDDWRIWTSRRFCALCETEHKGIDILPRIVIAAGLLLSAAAFASYLKRPTAINSADTSFAPVSAQRNLKPVQLYSSVNSVNSPSANSDITNVNSAPAQNSQINEQPQRENRTSEEAVFYCGAMTKKGTPCTRRVKTKGTLCWQHAKSGQIAPARF